MSRSFSIITAINFDKLDREIEEYINLNYCEPYIFMSEDTMKMIEKEIRNEFDIEIIGNNLNNNVMSVIAEYCGYKVFANNNLRLGMVEIR